MQIEQAELVAQLRKQAHEYSEASRMMAEAKSLRQADNTERRTDLYAFQSPEGTVQWKAADLIEQQAAQIAALSARPATLTEIETVARPDSDMVERVGWGLQRAWDDCSTLPPINLMSDERQLLARAAIAAMGSDMGKGGEG